MLYYCWYSVVKCPSTDLTRSCLCQAQAVPGPERSVLRQRSCNDAEGSTGQHIGWKPLWLLSPRFFSKQWGVMPALLLHFSELSLLPFFWVSSIFLHLCLSVNKNGQLNLLTYLAEFSNLFQLKQKFGGEEKSLKKNVEIVLFFDSKLKTFKIWGRLGRELFSTVMAATWCSVPQTSPGFSPFACIYSLCLFSLPCFMLVLTVLK